VSDPFKTAGRVRVENGPMTTISDRYRRVAEGFADRVAAVPDDRWSSPSPCEDWTARDVVRHIVDVHHMFLGFIDEAAEPTVSVDDDPLGAFTEARDTVAAALEDPRTATREYDGMFGKAVFGESIDSFLSADLVIHGWDLARATGGDERMDPAEVKRINESLLPMADKMRQPGGFGPEVETPPDADDQDRFLAFLGRDPRSPAST